MQRKLINSAWIVAALVAFAMTSGLTTSVASAQIDTCCVRIYNNTDCHVTVCVTLPGGGTRCVLLTAHTRDGFRFLCDANTTFFISNDACGNDHRITPQCTRAVLRGGCCATACLSTAHDGCYEIRIEQTAVDCPCP